MKLLCNHKWEILREYSTKSLAERSLEKTGECPSPRDSYQMEVLWGSNNVTLVVCASCGKIKQFVV